VRRVLKNKYFTVKSSLPASINKIFEDCATDSRGKKFAEGEFYTELFQKEGNNWLVKLDSPYFTIKREK
jgi:hypothetical protein